jgi:hypothetical protein
MCSARFVRRWTLRGAARESGRDTGATRLSSMYERAGVEATIRTLNVTTRARGFRSGAVRDQYEVRGRVDLSPWVQRTRRRPRAATASVP